MLEKRIYLDVCVLCRPFDDQQQARIRLETNALALILAKVRESDLQCVISRVHDSEINAIRNVEERQYLLFLLEQLGTRPKLDLLTVRQRAEELTNAGMGVADAAHVAFAEFAQADFVTVDDRLAKQCQQLNIHVWSGSPLAYCDKEDLR